MVTKDNLDGRWTIAAVNGRALSGVSLTLQGGAAAYRLACNSGAGKVSRNGDKLFLTDAALTEMACDAGRMQIDSEVINVLRVAMTMELTPPDRLRLVNEAGTLDLVRHRS